MDPEVGGSNPPSCTNQACKLNWLNVSRSSYRYDAGRKPASSRFPTICGRRRAPKRSVQARGQRSIDAKFLCPLLLPAGARLRVGRTAVVPESAYLILFRNWAAFESVVRWRRKDGTLGVKFLTMHDLKSPNSDEMKVLRGYCIEGTPGGSPVPLCGRSADQVAS